MTRRSVLLALGLSGIWIKLCPGRLLAAGTIRPVRTLDGVQHCDINFRLTGAHRF